MPRLKHRDGSPFPSHERILKGKSALLTLRTFSSGKTELSSTSVYSSSPIRKGNQNHRAGRGVCAGYHRAEACRSCRNAISGVGPIVTGRGCGKGFERNHYRLEPGRLQRIFGYKPKEIIGKSILTLIPQERQFEESEILRRIRGGDSIDHYETIRRCKDGRLIDVSLTISARCIDLARQNCRRFQNRPQHHRT